MPPFFFFGAGFAALALAALAVFLAAGFADLAFALGAAFAGFALAAGLAFASLAGLGLAGLALTVGLTVDANVLINERIREELKAGKSARAAVNAGYDRAFSAIFDGNVTMLIAALIMAQYGTGPIKGFAVTLIIGMLTNLFTGVTVTRLLFDFWVRGRRDVKLGIA